MNEMADKIQLVMNTIEQMNITATYDNMNRLLGCLQTLAGIRDDLRNYGKDDTDAS